MSETIKSDDSLFCSGVVSEIGIVIIVVACICGGVLCASTKNGAQCKTACEPNAVQTCTMWTVTCQQIESHAK